VVQSKSFEETISLYMMYRFNLGFYSRINFHQHTKMVNRSTSLFPRVKQVWLSFRFPYLSADQCLYVNKTY